MKRTTAASVLTVGTLVLAACGGTLSAGSDGGSATLRVGSYVPDTHPASVTGEQYFIKQATRISGGALQFELFPAEQLGKSDAMVDLTTSGTADIGTVSPSYVPDQLPISSVGELPAMFENSCQGSAAFHELTQPGGYLYETEFEPLGLRPLAGYVSAPYEIFTVSRPLDSLTAVEGLKLKTAGGAADATARLMDSVPVQLTNADIYTALERGTVDGRYGVYEYMPAVNSEDLLQHGTMGAQVAAFSTTLAISQQRWEMLSPKLQRALTAAGEKTVEHFCARADRNNAKVRRQLVAEHGWKTYELNPAEQKNWHETVAPVYDHWASGLNRSRGDTAASEALRAWREAVDAES